MMFFLTTVDQGVFWTAEGKLPVGYIGQKLRGEICAYNNRFENRQASKVIRMDDIV